MQDALASAAVINNGGVALQNRGAFAEAQSAFRAALVISPVLPDAHSNLAASLLQSGHRRSAWQALRRAVELVPDAPALYVRLGSVLAGGQPLSALPLKARRVATAIALVAARLSPRDSSLWSNLGLALAAIGRSRVAERAYRRALELAPSGADAHLGLASTQPRLEAVETLRAALGLGSSLSGPIAAVYYNLGNHLHLGRHEPWAAAAVAAAAEAVMGAAALPPSAPPTLLSTEAASSEAAAATSAAAVATVAVRCFEVATRLQPTYVDAYYNTALAAQQAHVDMPGTALTAYRYALALAPRDARVWSRLVTTLEWDGRTAEAAHLTNAAVRVCPTRARPRTWHRLPGPLHTPLTLRTPLALRSRHQRSIHRRCSHRLAPHTHS